jgi:hypothetical protein
MRLLLFIIGYVFIYGACYMFRKEDSKIQFLSKEWFIQVLCVTTGGCILIFGSSL